MVGKFYLYSEIKEKSHYFSDLIYSLPYITELDNFYNLFIPEDYKNGSIKLVIENRNIMKLEILLFNIKSNIKKPYTIEKKGKHEDKTYKFTIDFYSFKPEETNYFLNLTIKLEKDIFNLSHLRRLFYEFFNKNPYNINRGYYFNNLTFSLRNNEISVGYGYEFKYLNKKKKFKVNYSYKSFYEIYDYSMNDLIFPLIKEDLNKTVYVDNFEDIIKIVKERLYNYHEYKIIKYLREIKKLYFIDFII